jgi:hypothetical protein
MSVTNLGSTNTQAAPYVMVASPSLNGCNSGGHVQHGNPAASIDTVQMIANFVASADVLHLEILPGCFRFESWARFASFRQVIQF